MDTELHAPGAVVHQAIVSTKLGAHVLTFMFSSPAKEDLDGLVGTLNSVRLD